MSMPYIDGDTLADARNAYGCGIALDHIAGKLGAPEHHLRRLLKLPELEPQQPLETQLDLFAFDRLDAIL